MVNGDRDPPPQSASLLPTVSRGMSHKQVERPTENFMGANQHKEGNTSDHSVYINFANSDAKHLFCL